MRDGIGVMREDDAHKAIAQMLNLLGVMFRTGGGGLRLPIGLAVKFKALNGGRRAWPDMFIAEPRGKYAGLFIELKRSLDDYKTRSGKLRKTQHIQEQAQVLDQLRQRGYRAEFATYDEALLLINEYLEQK